MRKLFSLLAAVLFAGSMMAASSSKEPATIEYFDVQANATDGEYLYTASSANITTDAAKATGWIGWYSTQSSFKEYNKAGSATCMGSQTVLGNLKYDKVIFYVKNCTSFQIQAWANGDDRTVDYSYTPVGGATTTGSFKNTNNQTCDNSGDIALDKTKSYKIEVSNSKTEEIAVTYMLFKYEGEQCPEELTVPADETLEVGEKLEIEATLGKGNGDITYAWYKGSIAAENEVEGANTNKLTITAVATEDAGSYYCVASKAKCDDAQSEACVVTVTAPVAKYTVNYMDGETQMGTETVNVGEHPTAEGINTEKTKSTFNGWKLNGIITALNEVEGTADATVTLVGDWTYNPSTECQLISVKFSNTAFGSITEPVAEVLYKEGDTDIPEGKVVGDVRTAAVDAKIVVPYMAGTTAPTVDPTKVEVSASASAAVADNVLTVTAEDGTTKTEYAIEYSAITPLDVTADVETTGFTEVPAWIYNPYGWDSSKGVKFAKKVNETTNMRISKGNTRQYYFISAAKTLTLTSATQSRNINVYVNGTKLATPTATGAANVTIEIALDDTKANMVCIESNQTGGDGGFKSYAIEAIVAPYPTYYQRNQAIATYGTICLPYNATATGAVVMSFAGKNENGFVFEYVGEDEASSNTLEAGVPYLFRAIEATQTFTCETGATAVEPQVVKHFTGSYEELNDVSDMRYFLSATDNMFHQANGVHFAPNRCFFTTGTWSEIEDAPAAVEAAVRVVFPTYNPNVTGVEEASAVKATKALVNGKLVIVRGAHTFNANGAILK